MSRRHSSGCLFCLIVGQQIVYTKLGPNGVEMPQPPPAGMTGLLLRQVASLAEGLLPSIATIAD